MAYYLTYLDGPYRPKEPPRTGFFYPWSKVLLAVSALLGVVGLAAAALI